MSSALALALVCGALALLLAALGLWLWTRTAERERAAGIAAHMAVRLEPALAAAAGAPGGRRPAVQAAPRAAGPWRLRLQRYAPRLALAALSRGQIAAGVAAWVAAPVAGLLAAGSFGAVVLTIAMTALLAFLVWRRAAARRRRLVRQLPVFLDAIVRLITVGNSTQAAFQMAAAGAEAPLAGVLAEAASLMRGGLDLDRAVAQVGERHGIAELGLVAAVLRMSQKFGGRADQVLERVSNYLRDAEAAEEELVALSAETRLSAWILALLPIGVGALIIFMNGAYFSAMWADATGRALILGAGGLQALGAALLYRLARLGR